MRGRAVRRLSGSRLEALHARGRRTMPFRWLPLSLLLKIGLTAALFASIAAPAAAATCTQVDKLALQLPRPVQPEYAGFVVPNADTGVVGQPRFQDECLEIQVQGGGTGYDSLQELKDGRADLAIAEGSYVAQKISNGEALTIVAGYYQKNGLVWIGMNKNQFPTLQALAGKKIGVWCCGYDLAFPAIMKKAVQMVPTTSVAQNPLSLQQLISGDLDLASAMVYDELARSMQVVDNTTNFLKQKSDLYFLDPEIYGLTLVHNVLVVPTAKLASMRAKIVRFLRVVTKTWHFCRNNEVSCASTFSEYGVPTPHHMWQMREVNRFLFPALSGYGLGVLSLERWAAMNKWLVTSGALTSAVSNTVVDNTLALDAGALDDISQWAPFTKGSLHLCGEYGNADHRICQGNAHTLCSAGEEPSGSADYVCKKCEPGRFAPKKQRMNSCLVCPNGRYSKTFGQSACDACSPGRFWSATATTVTNASMRECTSCPVGLYSNSAGASACRACGKGTFAGKKGTAECERCSFGRFVDVTGQSECKKCNEGMATLYLGATSQPDCVCPKDAYQAQKSSLCLPCPVGMTCNVNSLESALLKIAANSSLDTKLVGEFPRLRPGYYTKRSAPFSVYLCKDDKTCPGDVPEKCAANMEGIACGQCKAGYYRDGANCYECTDVDESSFNYPVLQIIIGPFIVFLLYVAMRDSHEDWGSWWNEIGSCLFTFLVECQIIGLLVFTFLQYPGALSSIMMPWTYLVDVANMLRLSCSEYSAFRNVLIVKETAPGLMLVIFALTYVVCLIIGKLFAKLKSSPKETSEGEAPKEDIDCTPVLDMLPLKVGALFNVYFAVFHTFYVAICFISLQLFMCYVHPTGEWSLLFGPEVFCYASDEWKGMITESLLAVLAYIVAPIAGFACVVAAAPTKFHKPAFRERWKFLFIKFRPHCYWWGVFHMLRTLALCLTLVFSQEGSRQVYYIIVMLLTYLALLVIFYPWRHRSANLFDLFITTLLIYFCALSASFSRRHAWLDESLATWATATTFSPLVVLVGLLLWVAWGRMNPSSVKAKKAKQLELAANCRRVFAKYICLDKEKVQEDRPTSHEFIDGLGDQDRDVLRTASAMIVAELLGHQPGDAGLPWRVVHQEQKSGARTWVPTAPITAPAPPA